MAKFKRKKTYLIAEDFYKYKLLWKLTDKEMKDAGYGKQLEKHIQMEFIRRMSEEFPDMICKSTPNGGTANQRLNTNNKKLGMVNGAADVDVLWSGRILCIEFKKDNKAPISDAQKEYKLRCEKANIPYCIVWSVETALGIVRKWVE